MNENLGLYSPAIFPEETPIGEILEKVFSKTEIKKLYKQNGIKVAQGINAVYIKVGKRLFVKTSSEPAYCAQVWWEYHYSLKPKTLKWEKPKQEFFK